jgi:hypothetical protein
MDTRHVSIYVDTNIRLSTDGDRTTKRRRLLTEGERDVAGLRMRMHTSPGIQDFSLNSPAFGETVRHQRRMLHIRENVKRDCTRLPRGLKRLLYL